MYLTNDMELNTTSDDMRAYTKKWVS
jgi:hypothetical protein